MRRTALTGLLLVVAAAVTVLVSSWLDLELESTVVLGVTAGAVLALVPEAGPGGRVAGFLLGVLASLVAYLVRAGYTPDTAAGRTVYVVLAIALCVLVAVVSANRLPLWSVLLGAGTFAGAFEATYAAAPPRVVDNSFGGVTTLLLCVAIGFVAVGLADSARGQGAPRREEPDHDDTTTDEQMETAK
ncbi:MAG: hypothetical protein ACRDO4_04750 [Nocardioides sp.]